MRAKLKFDLSNEDERMEHFRCVKSLDMAIVLFDILLNLKSRVDDLDECFAEIDRMMGERGLNLDELIN